MANTRNMPDVAFESRAQVSGTLDKVGMSKIEVGVKINTEDFGDVLVPAFADAYVNLVDPQAKGIHMSRLFLQLHEGLKAKSLSADLLDQIASKFLESHSGVSSEAYLAIKFQLPLNRKALLSENVAFRHYSAEMTIRKTSTKAHFEIQVVVPYSSTCPCSAALARQLIQEEFLKDFAGDVEVKVDQVSHWLRKETSIVATPHSQRSYATVGLRFADVSKVISHQELIDIVENALKTPVQGVVKREDEQEFARLNGTNLMFCEDASRKLQSAVSHIADLQNYRIHVSHEESLHPHNAVAVVSGGQGQWEF